MNSFLDPVNILSALIACPSVTPDEAGALDLVESILRSHDFIVERPFFTEVGARDVENLYAVSSSQGAREGRRLMFAGHTDVVPPGDEAAWTFPPFTPTIKDGQIYGRGAVDMKGAIACFLAALSRYRSKGKIIKGSLSFLITGDEEGPAINGTEKLLKWAIEKGYSWDACIVGEPTSVEKLGDTIKNGRRGSLSGKITVHGTQCHIAWPQASENNPVRGLLTLLNSLLNTAFDKGVDPFPATNLEVSSIETGNPVVNVIPSKIFARFNVRFNTLWTIETLSQEIQNRLLHTSEESLKEMGRKIIYDLEWLGRPSEAFLTRNEELIDLVVSSVNDVTGLSPICSASGGTSDARFIKNYCPVIELGLIGKTAHRVDESVSLQDLETLTDIYETILTQWFS